MKQVFGKQIRETFEEVIDPSVTALLVIDMQLDAISDKGKLAAAGNDVKAMQEIVPRCVQLVEAARRCGVLVVHVRVLTLADGRSDSPSWLRMKGVAVNSTDFFLEGSEGAEFIDELKPLPGEPIVTKHRSSAFVGTNLEILLRASGIETVVVIGEQTPGCVEATYRDAAYHDFYNVLVEDCVAAFDQRQHEASLLIQRARHDVCSMEQVLAVWDRT